MALLLLLPLLAPAHAGGGPMNVLVLYNGDDPDAESVAEYYADARSIPLGQLCGVGGIDPLAQTMTFDDYAATVQPAFRACLAALPQPGEIDYVVTIRGLPYRVDITDGYSASLEMMVQVDGGVDQDGVEIAGQPQRYSSSSYYLASVDNPAFVDGAAEDGDFTVSNPYSASYQSAPAVVRDSKQPKSFHASTTWTTLSSDLTGHFYVVSRLDGFDYDDARDLVDRGSAADGTFPTAELLCMAAADDARGARDPECEFTSRMLASAGFNGAWLTPHDASLSGHTVSGYFTGAADLQNGIAGETYEPGAITDNLTSYGAVPSNFFCSDDGLTCPASESQTSIARYVRAGATGAHGTVNEPLNNVFPLASSLLFYTFGYNLGESQLFALRYVYWQNLFLGDPLTTPYAVRPVVTFPGQVAEGSPFVVQASHPDGVAEVRVYVGGVLLDAVEVDGEPATVASVAVPSWVGTSGDVLDVTAVAIAQDVHVDRAGWPQPDQQPRAEVQGWTRGEVLVTDVEPVDSGDSAAEDSGGQHKDLSGDCGCAATGVDVGWAAGVVAVGVLAGRRRRAV